MGLIRLWFSVLGKPITRTVGTVAESVQRIRGDIHRLKQAQARLREAAQEASGGPVIDVTLSDEDLLRVDPSSLKDPAQKFRAMYLQNGWSEAALKLRLRAVKGRKYFGIVLGLLMLFGGMVSILTAPAWLALIMFVITVAGSALGGTITFLYGLYQSQLETRSLHGARSYLGRPDLFSHLIS